MQLKLHTAPNSLRQGYTTDTGTVGSGVSKLTNGDILSLDWLLPI